MSDSAISASVNQPLITDDNPEILSIPELVRNKILSYLEDRPFQLLILREVCSTTKQWITEFPTQHKAFKNYQVTIQEEGWNTLETFLEMGLQISNFHFKIQNLVNFYLYHDLHMLKFLENYVSKVKRLRVSKFGSCILNCEFEFFEALTSIEELQVDLIDEIPEPEKPTDFSKSSWRVPETFQNLKVLQLGKVSEIDNEEANGYIWKIIRSCRNLELFCPPEIYWTLQGMNDISGEWRQTMKYVQNREISHPGKPNLRFFNMKHFNVSCQNYSREFLQFAKFCSVKKIKLLNVDSNLLSSIHSEGNCVIDLYSFLSKTVVSMVNMHPAVRLIDLPNLQKLNVKSTVGSGVVDYWNFYDQWPALKTLKIHFDSIKYGGIELDELITWLLDEINRPACESLTLSWAWHPDGSGPLTDTVDIVKSQNIIPNFPNLKRLKLVRWNAKNLKFIHLWKGFKQLEEVWIEDCPLLGNVGFIGKNPEEPIFLKLEGMKKLTLKLNAKSNVTDRCFRDVFRHLKLKEFNLICDSPIESVTIKGIEALLDGEFANSIEKFSFKTWSLANTSPDQHVELQKKFKSV